MLIEWLIRRYPERYRLIPRVPDGKPLLRQFKLTNWAYLQSFQGPEVDWLFHVHRWRWMISFVLSGAFIEERYPGGRFIVHAAPSVYTMDDTVIHRMAAMEPGTWTLFLMFGNKEEWGYYERPKYIPANEMITDELRVRSL